MNKQTVRDVSFAGKRVLVRVDFNVPLDGQTVTDDTRVRAAVPTIKYILDQKPKVVLLMSHLGRPKDGPDPKYSMAPVAPVLQAHLGAPVTFVDDCVGPKVEAAVAAAAPGAVLLLENTRFYKGEEKNDPELAAKMAAFGDVFVNDAFGTAHRAHASNVGVSSHLPAVAGLLMEKEIDYLATALEDPARPFVAILGGAKVSDKIAVIDALIDKCDALIIGGGMANTFFLAQGVALGKSLVEADAVETAKALLARGRSKLVLPVDAVIGDKFAEDSATQTVDVAAGVPDGWAIYDIGPKTQALFTEKLTGAKTVVWNGPMGVFEIEKFAHGTFAVAKALAKATEAGAVSIVGGGDSAAAVEQSGLADKITHISTGGGASLEMLEGQALPGVVALKDRV
ncbi:MAG: phosphoglycerate kinase [Chloroflexi bacterium]|nr:phosphoglycerate kinase [Chloroflexota bacterium]MBV6435871.1 Bifunctional PGK/TIM [Anaerolineae bacterium]MDL1917167.1 phosphoglycerate kinase [Anaerolineae bacterium CFX4]OQY86835.1 MAG: phosphoglycerate kinase [Anaerolineae bacterium UTCFX5]MBW7879063.1 phosphoglycerate kinase [Anaerolineae bacterium]